jgi:hypothetical protein
MAVVVIVVDLHLFKPLMQSLASLQHLSTQVHVLTTSLPLVGEAFGPIVIIISTLNNSGLKIGFV